MTKIRILRSRSGNQGRVRRPRGTIMSDRADAGHGNRIGSSETSQSTGNRPGSWLYLTSKAHMGRKCRGPRLRREGERG